MAFSHKIFSYSRDCFATSNGVLVINGVNSELLASQQKKHCFVLAYSSTSRGYFAAVHESGIRFSERQESFQQQKFGSRILYNY